MEKHINYLLFVPSLLSRTEVVVYRAAAEDLGDTAYPNYSGLQTNEAVTKFLIDYLYNEGEHLDKIIMLCTAEVLENQLSSIGGQTTCEYYKGEIKKFIRERNYIKMTEIDQLFEIVPYFPRNNENENQIISKLEKIVKPEDARECHKRLFVDFTGGNRSSALTMVFACRILDQAGVEMGKILYSNLGKEENGVSGIIEECTKTYQIFSAFERRLMIENDIIKEDLPSGKEQGAKSNLDIARKELLRAQNLNQQKEIEKTAEKISSLSAEMNTSSMSHMDKENLKAIEKKANETLEERNDPLLQIKNRIKSRNYNQALNLFRENIIQILYTSGIIEVTDRYKKEGNLKGNLISDEIAAAYNYYEGDKKKPTYMQMIRKYMWLLCNNPASSPIEIKQKYFGKDFFALRNYMDQVLDRGFRHYSFSKRISDEKIISYVEELYEEKQDLKLCIHQYSNMDNLYMGYGFPFACTYGGVEYFHGYDTLYQKNFKNGVDNLQKLFEGKKEREMKHILDKLEAHTYEKMIRALCEEQREGELRMLFPFQLNSQSIKSETLDPVSWEEFSYSFAQSYCIIKDVRNSTIHPKDLEKRKIKRAFEELEKVLRQIEDIRNKTNYEQ